MKTLLLFFAAALAASAYAGHSKPENTHLVTMRKAELMEIINCVSKSRDVNVCEELSNCESMMAPQVIRAHKKCRDLYSGESWTTCKPDQELFPNPSVPSKIFDCVVENTTKETPEEKMQMVEFETCTRHLYAKNCFNYPRHEHLYH